MCVYVAGVKPSTRGLFVCILLYKMYKLLTVVSPGSALFLLASYTYNRIDPPLS